MNSYTAGNWTVSDTVTDTVTEAKSVSIPDLSYGSDYAKTSDEPSEAIVVNTTGTGITSPESIRYGYSLVKDIYTNTEIDLAARAPISKGVQVLCEIKHNYHAENSVSGASIDLPVVGRIVLRFPTFQAVTKDLVDDLLKRTIACAFDTGSVDSSRILEAARGSLLPENV